jgi:hypothetical protein
VGVQLGEHLSSEIWWRLNGVESVEQIEALTKRGEFVVTRGALLEMGLQDYAHRGANGLFQVVREVFECLLATHYGVSLASA